MLSILIPTKDYCCCTLVEELCRQANECGIDYEIIVGEDGSSPENMSLNAPVAQLPHCRIVVRQPNVGRSRIRNILAREARGKNIMFIDSDAAAEQNDILLLYTQALKEHRVVCGGLYHSKKPQDGNCSLRHRYELAAEISKRAVAKKIKMPVLIEINIGREEQKGGVYPEKAIDFIKEIAELEGLDIQGLMTMAPAKISSEQYREYFRQTKALFDEISTLDIKGVKMKTLSMGMSDSYEEAAQCGATMVRVGSAIFGKREYPSKI